MSFSTEYSNSSQPYRSNHNTPHILSPSGPLSPILSPSRVRTPSKHSKEKSSVESLMLREQTWSTNFPAEFYQKNAVLTREKSVENKSRISDAALAIREVESMGSSQISSPLRSNITVHPSCPQSKEELHLIKHAMIREGLLEKLWALADIASQSNFHVSRANELLQLLLKIREANVVLMQGLADLHNSILAQHQHDKDVKLPAFIYEGQNYCLKMLNDMDFLGDMKSLAKILGVDSAMMICNPFMMPKPIPQRNFAESEKHLEIESHSSHPPQFTFEGSAERVSEAERYLIWCIYHTKDEINNDSMLLDPVDSQVSPNQNKNILSPPKTSIKKPPKSPFGSRKNKTKILTWQKRAEQQLKLLSQPMACSSPKRQIHLEDSSNMMKRNGFLPQLPVAPARTLTELMHNVQVNDKNVEQKVIDESDPIILRVYMDNILYTASGSELSGLAISEDPPPRLVMLVCAAVQLLLSPPNSIPNDLSWPSCRNMLLHGNKLIEMLEELDIESIPLFKKKALLPFVKLDGFNPATLANICKPIASLCAWILHSLGDLVEVKVADSNGAKERFDQNDLLQELDVEEELNNSSHPSHENCQDTELDNNSNCNPHAANIPHSPAGYIENTPREQGPGEDSKGSSNRLLIKTNEWTHRGITYFLSFFVEKDNKCAEELSAGNEAIQLSIKMYEPIGSMETMMHIDKEDIKLNFGTEALQNYNSGNYKQLCDVILDSLDSIMEKDTTNRTQCKTGASNYCSSEYNYTTQSACLSSPITCREGDGCKSSMHSSVIDYVKQNPSTFTSCETNNPTIAQSSLRQNNAKSIVEQKRQNVLTLQRNTAVLTIQCFARQTLARKKVKELRKMQNYTVFS